MSGLVLASGDLAEVEPLEVLRLAESWRLSGRLRFETGSGEDWGEVRLLGGEPLEDTSPLPDGRDPLESFLEKTSGRFELSLQLPPLPVSRGDALRREGSLAVHVPADLMNYCERVGLSGRLVLRQGERCAEARYERGELLSIRVDGRDEGDLHAVFGWEEGSFLIEAHGPASEQAPDDDGQDVSASGEAASGAGEDVEPARSRPGEDTSRFLRVVEVELARIVEERERRRPASRSSPEAPLPRPAPRPESLPPPRSATRREPTVRIVYVRAEHDVSDGAETEASDRQLPEPAAGGAGPMAAGDQSAEAAGDWRGALGWALLVLLLVLGAVGLLSRLPPLR